MLDHLFRPLGLGPVEIPNRIVSTSHQTNLVHDHLPTAEFIAYHEARARGGAGLIVLEATAVDPSGRLHPHSLAGYLEGIVDGYRRVAGAVRPHGTRLFAQLFHGGRERIESAPRSPVVAPSAVPSQRFKTEPRTLSEVEIDELVAAYGAAAARAEAGGLDGVEISAAHSYLAAQFFTPSLNQRRDRFRAGPAFLLAVIDAVRAAAPGMALGVRFSADSLAAQGVARELAGRVDYLGLALGESSTYRGSTAIVPPPTMPENAIAETTESFRVGPPIVAASRIVDPVEADRLIAEARADAVGMTRALITDPELPRKARAGRVAEIVRCIGCNACIAHYHAGTPIACAQNPRTGRELILPRPRPAARRRRVAVVGAGPAGLAAAAELCVSSHEVVVLERTERVGGQIALAGVAPVHAETARALAANYATALADADLRLGHEADIRSVRALEPDAVIVATGAAPYAPAIPLSGTTPAWDVLAGRGPAGGRVVVADWGGDPSGLACADLLAHAGCEVTLALAAVAVGEAIHQYQRNVYLERLYRAGVHIEHHLELVRAADGRAVFRNLFAPEIEVKLVADAVVLALGRIPVDTLAYELEREGIRVERAGDCLSPRSLEEAILEGTLAARAVAG